MPKEKIETYPEAARVIHLYLKEFCNESLPFPEMIADAARKADAEIYRLRVYKRMIEEVQQILAKKS